MTDVSDIEIGPGIELISIPNSSDPAVWWFLLKITPTVSGISRFYGTEAAARINYNAGTVAWEDI
jgi:hypothetical protein